MNQLLQVFHASPLGRAYMETVWEWAKANPGIYLDGEFETREEFLAPPAPNVTEYMVILDGQAVAHLGFIETERGTQISLITAPYAPLFRLVHFFQQLRTHLQARGVTLYVSLPADSIYEPARRLARLLSIPNYGNKKQTAANAV